MHVYTITIDASHICIGRQEQSLNEQVGIYGCVLILLWYLGDIYIYAAVDCNEAPVQHRKKQPVCRLYTR